MAVTTAVKASDETLKVNEEKWSKTLMEAGWTALPSMILEKQHALGLDPIDVNIIAHLSIYWWKKNNLPHPSVAKIAKAIGIAPRTVQKHVAAMEANGFLTRHMRPRAGLSNNTNMYSFEGLIKAATPFAKEKLAAKAEQHKKEEERVASKKAKLSLVSSA
jgi:DNA-binding transcriptional regulator YhcF (GntR family)